MAKARSSTGTRDYPLPPGAFRPCTLPLGMNRYRAAGYLGVSLPVFDQMHRRGDLPPAKRVSPKILIWDRLELDGVTIPAIKRAEPPYPKVSDERFEQIARAVVYGKQVQIYVLAIPGFVKIGFTAQNLARRVRGIQTGCPSKIEVLAVIHAPRGLEKRLHRRFSAYRSAGEWFRNEGALAAWIAEGCPA